MYCGNCGRPTSDAKRHCEHCNFDLIHLQKLLNEDDDEESDNEFRSAADVARRCLVLCAVVAASHGENRPGIMSWLKAQGLWKAVSPKEKRFLQATKPTETQVIDASWKVEALPVLLWALQRVPAMDESSRRADHLRLQALLPYLGATSPFIDDSKLRPEEEIRDMKERIHDAHWAARDAEIKGHALPEGVDAEVIVERHRAINWIMGYDGQAWDAVTADT